MKLYTKLLSIVMILALVLSLGACTSGDGDQGTDDSANDKSDKYELALITDIGTIDDKSFNQGAWEGLEAYAQDNNVTHKYYKPTEKSDDAYMASIDLAVAGGAKLIVCPGYLFEGAVYNAQTKYSDVKFVILDGSPRESTDSPAKVADNTYSVFYAEQQAGFLAGYSIVKEGYTKLGFMGGVAVPAVVRYGYGFIQGADYAAKELGISDVQINYTYVGNFDATPENQAKAASWYNDGTEVIFACGGAVGNSVMKAAESAEKLVIGVDVDQSSESDTVITSSMKNLSKSVYSAIEAYYGNSFPGGTIATLDAKQDGVELPMDTSKFEKFTQTDYDDVYKKIVSGDITVKDDTVADDAGKVPVEKVSVEVIK